VISLLAFMSSVADDSASARTDADFHETTSLNIERAVSIQFPIAIA
jgi:hypothetical protein